MYLVATRIEYNRPLSEDLVRKGEQELLEPLRQQRGLRAYYSAQLGERKSLTVHLWDSRRSAEQAMAALAARLQTAMADDAAGPVSRSMGEVLFTTKCVRAEDWAVTDRSHGLDDLGIPLPGLMNSCTRVRGRPRTVIAGAAPSPFPTYPRSAIAIG